MKKDSGTDKSSCVGNRDCLKLLEFCGAACCRCSGGVALTGAEISSGRYETEHLCMVSRGPCGRDEDCFHRLVQLKTSGNNCIYIGEDNRCSIYEERPKMCRDMKCAAIGGSNLRRDPEAFIQRETLRLSEGQMFAPAPHRMLKRIIVDEKSDRIFFMVRDSSFCEDEMLEERSVFSGANEEQYNRIAALFDGRATIGEIEQKAAGILGAPPGEALRRFVILCNTMKVLHYMKRPGCL